MVRLAVTTLGDVTNSIFSVPSRTGQAPHSQSYRKLEVSGSSNNPRVRKNAHNGNPKWNPTDPNAARDTTFHSVLINYLEGWNIETTVSDVDSNILTYPLYYRWSKDRIEQDVRRIYKKIEEKERKYGTESLTATGQGKRRVSSVVANHCSRTETDSVALEIFREEQKPKKRLENALECLVAGHESLVYYLADIARNNGDRGIRSVQPGIISAALAYIAQKLVLRNSSIIVPLGDRELSSATGLSKPSARSLKKLLFDELGTPASRSNRREGIRKVLNKTKADELHISVAALRRISEKQLVKGDKRFDSNTFTKGFFSVRNPLWQGGHEGVDHNVRYLLLCAAQYEGGTVDYLDLARLARKIGYSRQTSYRVAQRAAEFCQEIELTSENLLAVATGDITIADGESINRYEHTGEEHLQRTISLYAEEQNAWRGYEKVSSSTGETWVVDPLAREGWHSEFQERYIMVGREVDVVNKRKEDIKKSRRAEAKHEEAVLRELFAITKNKPTTRDKRAIRCGVLWNGALNHKDYLLSGLAECFVIQRDNRLRQGDYNTPTTNEAVVSAFMLYIAGYEDTEAELLRGFLELHANSAGKHSPAASLLTSLPYVEPTGTFMPHKLVADQLISVLRELETLVKKKVLPTRKRFKGASATSNTFCELRVEYDDRDRPVVAID